MEKYNKKMLYDYINGLPVEGYDIDELEDTSDFMMAVIEFSKDKRLYDLCGESVKKDYEFVRFIIETFSHDPSFISSVAMDYLESVEPEDITYKELVILMSNQLDSREIHVFNLKALSFYAEVTTAIHVGLEADPSLAPTIGKGFLIIMEDYATSDIIKAYFAKKMALEIFFSNELQFEALIHKMARSKEELDKPNTFLLSIIERYDSFLAGYIATHLDLLEEVRKELSKVLANWDKYLENLKVQKSDIFFQKVGNICEEHIGFIRFNDIDVIEYFRKNPKYADLFIGYDVDSEEEPDEESQKEYYSFISELFDQSKMTVTEKSVYDKIRKMAEELTRNDYIDKTTDDYDDPSFSGVHKVIDISAMRK